MGEDKAVNDVQAMPLVGEARLRKLRDDIDQLDTRLVELLAVRFKCTEEIGQIKAELGLPPTDPAREEQLYARLCRIAEQISLDPAIVKFTWQAIMSQAVDRHIEIATTHAEENQGAS